MVLEQENNLFQKEIPAGRQMIQSAHIHIEKFILFTKWISGIYFFPLNNWCFCTLRILYLRKIGKGHMDVQVSAINFVCKYNV